MDSNDNKQGDIETRSKAVKLPSPRRKSDLAVITKAKDLCNYIFVVTQKSPKQFRHTLVDRLNNISIDILMDLYKANGIMIISDKRDELCDNRLMLQNNAMTNLDMIDYLAQLSYEQKCILFAQWTQITKRVVECQVLLAGWINSDNKRKLGR